MKNKTIYGCGFPKKFKINKENIKEAGNEGGLKGFIELIEIDKSRGGLTSGSLDGVMAKFKNGYLVVWSCGEYIDYAIFKD